MLLQAQNLKKTYSTESKPETVLRGVDLNLAEKEFVAILGPSGCGKSTLLHLLAGLDRPDSGQIFFRKTDITQSSDKELALYRRNDVGVVFQFFNLFPALSVLENISMPGILRGESSAKVAQRARLLAEQVGLSHRLEHRAAELSGGEMQRAALCRALLNRPAFILADEPTGNLDSNNRQQVHQLLKDLQQQEGVTFFVVTHDPEITQIADRVISMHDGKVKT